MASLEDVKTPNKGMEDFPGSQYQEEAKLDVCEVAARQGNNLPNTPVVIGHLVLAQAGRLGATEV